MFISEDLYLLPHEVLASDIPILTTAIVEVISEPEPEEEETMQQEVVEMKESGIKISVAYKPVMFITDKPLTGLAEETFKNLVNKGLSLSEDDFSILTEDKVTFANPEEINSKKIILFGTTFTGIQQKYKVHTSENQLILIADSMDKIAQNVELKRLLWAQLQMIFPK